MTTDSGSVTGYSTAAVAVGAGLTLNEWIAVASLVLAVAGFIFNIWFKFKYKRRE